MGTNPASMQRSLVSQSPGGVPPCVLTHSQPEAPRRSTGLSLSALRAFADGFGGGLIGGLIYCLGLAYFHPGGLEFAWPRVLALSLIFGGFEMWRVTRTRTLRSVRIGMLWTLTAGLFVLWALGAVISASETPLRETPPHLTVM